MLKEIVNGIEVIVDQNKEIEIKAQWAAYDAEIVEKRKTEHLDKRKREYPTLSQLIDYLYESMKANEIPASKGLVDAIDALKAKYPDPRNG